MKTTVIDKKSGKARAMEPRFAKILTKLGRARYMTRELRAAEPEDQDIKTPEIEPKQTPKKRGRKPKAAK